MAKRKKKSVRPKVKRTKKVIGVFKDLKVSRKKYRRRKVKGKTQLTRWKKDNKRGFLAGTVKSTSIIIYNPYKKDDEHALEKFAKHIEENKRWFYRELDKIFYRAKDERGRTIPAYTSVVIVEQRDRRDPRQFHYEPYFMKPPATKENVFVHTYNTVRNHGEFIRQRIKKMGYTDVKYDFENFWAWYVPSIRVELLYQ